MRLKLENKTECHDITLDLDDVYLTDGNVLLDPIVKDNGVLNILKKTKIIKDVCGVVSYNYISVPVAKLNMGKLREYDYDGVMKHLEKIIKLKEVSSE